MDQLLRIDRASINGAGPAYRRLARVLSDRIEARAIEPGAPLPTERSMATSLGLSRVTVRAAYRQLAQDGLTEVRAGSGNYVRDKVFIEQPLWRLTSFSQDMAARGSSTTTDVLGSEQRLAGKREREALQLAGGASVQVVERLRRADGQPLAIETAILPDWVLGGDPFSSGSLYAFLTARNMKPASAVQRLKAGLMCARHAKLLEVADASPAMLTERIACLEDGRPVEFTTSCYRGDAYEFVAQLVMSGGPS